MNENKREQWKNEALGIVLLAISDFPALQESLIFKGARILRYYIEVTSRVSLDIDTNLTAEVCSSLRNHTKIADFLQDNFTKALHTYFEKGNPVRYKLENVKVEKLPDFPTKHPFGWDGYNVMIRVFDHKHAKVRALPTLKVDIATPEKLSRNSWHFITIGGDHKIKAYTLERITGEKLRAFLSSLPAYIKKIGKRECTVRVKDIYDVAKVYQVKRIECEKEFWKTAASEFKMACGSRFIDCEGIATFEEQLEMTRELYEKDKTLPDDIPFETAWKAITEIIMLFEKLKVVPFEFPVRNL